MLLCFSFLRYYWALFCCVLSIHFRYTSIIVSLVRAGLHRVFVRVFITVHCAAK